jgi:hypothetical protein
MNDLIKLLRQLEASRFYGSLEVKFESGQVTVIKKTESIKPTTNNHRENRGGTNDQSQ